MRTGSSSSEVTHDRRNRKAKERVNDGRLAGRGLARTPNYPSNGPTRGVAAGGYARAPMRQLEEGERDESEDAPGDKRLEIKVHEVELAIELSRSRVRVRRVRQRVLNVQRGLDDWIEGGSH